MSVSKSTNYSVQSKGVGMSRTSSFGGLFRSSMMSVTKEMEFCDWLWTGNKHTDRHSKHVTLKRYLHNNDTFNNKSFT